MFSFNFPCVVNHCENIIHQSSITSVYSNVIVICTITEFNYYIALVKFRAIHSFRL